MTLVVVPNDVLATVQFVLKSRDFELVRPLFTINRAQANLQNIDNVLVNVIRECYRPLRR